MINHKKNNKIAKCHVISDPKFYIVRDKTLEFINTHPDIEVISIQYWDNPKKWFSILTYYSYAKKS